MTPDQARLILYRLDQQDTKLDRIEAHVQRTNGRVTTLELWKARMEGVRLAIGWLPATLVTVAASTVTGVLVFVLTH